MARIFILCNNDALLRAYPAEEAAMAEAVRLQALARAEHPEYCGAFHHVHAVQLVGTDAPAAPLRLPPIVAASSMRALDDAYEASEVHDCLRKHGVPFVLLGCDGEPIEADQ